MRDDFDSLVADRFTVLDDVPVPDIWSRVQFKLLDPTPVEFTEAEPILIDLEAPSPSKERRRRGRWMLAAAAVLLVVAAAVALLQRGSDKPAVVTTTTPDTTTAEVRSTTISNGWVAYVERDPRVDDLDINLVREGSPDIRIAGTDDDAVDQVCPAFSPDGTRLAYGQIARTDVGGFGDAGLVIADLTPDGIVSSTTTIALDADQLATADGAFRAPCAVWSADGRWLAFGAGTYEPHIARAWVDEVWVADTETGDLRQLPGVSAVTDFEWAPDANDLYVADEGAIDVYSVTADETRELIGTEWGVDMFAVSPDGHSIAVQGVRESEARLVLQRSELSADLRLMDFDGTGDSRRLVDRGVISQDFDQMHGLGPVWSPDGTRIAFQRSCDFTPDNRPCSEQEQVVVVTVNDNGPPRPDEMPPMLDMAQVVIPPPETPQPDGTTMSWWPFYVTWSPDSTTLLYGAWSDSAIPEQVVPIAVRVDHESPPVLLSPTSNLAPYDGVLRLHYQSWSRQQG